MADFKKLNGYNVKDAQARESIQDLADADTHIIGRVSALEDAESSLETRVGTAEGDIDALETRMASAEADIDALEQSGTIDDHKWDNVALDKDLDNSVGGNVFVPTMVSANSTEAGLTKGTAVPQAYALAKYDGNNMLTTNTPLLGNSSHNVANTEWVQNEINAKIRFGSVLPTDDIGRDGDIYIYIAPTGGGN